MKERIIVMGGSFNPPTIAHYQLMKNAMEAVGASKGIFVPVSHAYLKRKMRKAEYPMCLSEALRMEMLRGMCAEEPRLAMCDYEIQHPFWGTPETMGALQEIYPEAELYFLAGADKMRLIKIMAEKHAFLEHFGVAVVQRDDVNPMQVIYQDEYLRHYQNSFLLVSLPKGMDGVSSTVIRKHFITGKVELIRENLHENVWNLFSDLKREDYPPEIEKFEKEYEFLSNGYPSPIEYEGVTYPNAEAAFQAARCKNSMDRYRFLKCDRNRAKMIASRVSPRDDWEEVKVVVMEEILRKKFEQSPELAKKLLETGKALLIFGNGGKDKFWGMDLYSSIGENHLGNLLMKIRSEIFEKTQTN